METVRNFKDIICFKAPSDRFIAFHSKNLEVAEVDHQVWQAFSPSPSDQAEVLEELQSWNDSSSENVKDGKVDFGITSLTINTTQLCNLKCTYCAADGDGTYGDPVARIDVEKTLPQIKRFIDRLPSGKTFNLHFLGGEPLLYQDSIRAISNYVRLYTAGKDVKIRHVISTNGTLINEQTIELFKEFQFNVQISLDGPPEVNDAQRPSKSGKGSTEATVAGLKKVLSAKEQLGAVGISAVFDSRNLDLVKSYRFFQPFDVDWIEFTFSYIDKNSDSNQLYIDQMIRVAELAFSLGGEKELRRLRTFDKYFRHLDNQQRIENYCGAGKSFLMMDSRNQLYSCPWDVGHPSELLGKNGELDPPAVAKYADNLVDKNNCGTCWARYLCGGGCMYTHKQATGSKDRVDTDFCHRTRSLINSAILYYEKVRSEA